MDTGIYKEAIANADIAFTNENYEGAVKWYEKALEQSPKDEYALSRAGAALVALKQFKRAFGYFQKAIEADPASGDNLFNMANAYFFAGDVTKAMEYYTSAMMKQCSPDVKARIFYQLALMCTLKQDFKAALVNYQKYEDFDKTGAASLDTDIISEKIQLYLKLEDYKNAIKLAVKWVSLAPSDLRAYMVYFNLLMADEQYEEAQNVLDDTMKYAVNDDAGKFAVDVCRANFYTNAAGSKADTAGDFDEKAYALLSELIVSPTGSEKDKNELVLSLAELCIKLDKLDEAIELMQMLKQKPAPADAAEAAPEEEKKAPAAVDQAEIDAMREKDIARMNALVSEGIIDESIGEQASVNYDEEGHEVREYPEGTFDGLPDDVDPTKYGLPSPEKLRELENAAAAANTAEFNARVNYMLLSCYSAKEDYENALEYAGLVKNSGSGSYYPLFGHYAEAFATLQLAKEGKRFTMQEAEEKYNRELAFLRTETMKRNENSLYTILFRARMYAELGKYDKALDLAELLESDDKAAVTQYIEDCRRLQDKA